MKGPLDQCNTTQACGSFLKISKNIGCKAVDRICFFFHQKANKQTATLFLGNSETTAVHTQASQCVALPLIYGKKDAGRISLL